MGTILSAVLKPWLGSSWLCFCAVQQKLKVERVWWDQVVQSTTTHLPKGLGHRELKLLHWLPINFRIQFEALALIFKATNGGSANGIKG